MVLWAAAVQAEAERGERLQGLLMDILWSDPTESDAVHGVHANRMRGGETAPNRQASRAGSAQLHLTEIVSLAPSCRRWLRVCAGVFQGRR